MSLTQISSGQDFHLESAGGRFGFYPFGAASHFYEADVFANFDLPWRWDLGKKWSLQSRVDGSLGWLGEADHNAVIASIGPGLLFARENLPISFEAGASPTVISISHFRDKDLGDLFQFASHLGVNFDVLDHVRLSFRYQHMSNAGLNPHNPGLNMFMFGVGYLF